jgi:hypothetical protein
MADGAGLRIAALTGAPSGETDPVLSALADALASDGVRLAGAVQRTRPATPKSNKRMELVLLPSGEAVTISEERPLGAVGCSLDPGVFERVAARIASGIGPGSDAVLLSKFGQREIEGQGLRAAIVAAAEHDLPLVIGVAPARIEAFEAFLGAPVDRLPADVEAARRWVISQIPEA